MISCRIATDSVTLPRCYDPGMREPPPPGECHPAYQDMMSWLRDWLNGSPRYPPDRVQVPFTQRLNLTLTGSSAHEPAISTHILIKEKAAGLAPYVGDPFVYIWYVATDELGRSVAGDAKIRYLDRPF